MNITIKGLFIKAGRRKITPITVILLAVLECVNMHTYYLKVNMACRIFPPVVNVKYTPSLCTHTDHTPSMNSLCSSGMMLGPFMRDMESALGLVKAGDENCRLICWCLWTRESRIFCSSAGSKYDMPVIKKIIPSVL